MKVSVEVERAALPDQGWQRVAFRARVMLCDRRSDRPLASIEPTTERVSPARPALGGSTNEQQRQEQQMIAKLERLGYERARARYMAAIQMQRPEQEIERRREDAQ